MSINSTNDGLRSKKKEVYAIRGNLPDQQNSEYLRISHRHVLCHGLPKRVMGLETSRFRYMIVNAQLTFYSSHVYASTFHQAELCFVSFAQHFLFG